MGGEVVALDRHFFRSVGGYDPGMLLWGEEQIELSVRVRRTGSCSVPARDSQSDDIWVHQVLG